MQAAGLKFEAEATGWLQSHNIPLTNDAPKYGVFNDTEARVLAILGGAGFVDAAEGDGPWGVVLNSTCFYAESGGQVGEEP